MLSSVEQRIFALCEKAKTAKPEELDGVFSELRMLLRESMQELRVMAAAHSRLIAIPDDEADRNRSKAA